MQRDSAQQDVGAEPPEVVRATDNVFRAVEESGLLPDGIRGSEAATAVLCTLTRRLSGGDASALAESTSRLGAVLHRCAKHRDEPPEKLDRAMFLRAISDHLGIESDVSARIARAVFDAVQRRMSANEIDDVANQLPLDLSDLWKPEGKPI